MGRKRRLPRELVEARITALSHEGRGITHDEQGRPVFVDCALPGEVVRYRYTKLRRSRAEASAVEICVPAAERIEPGCPHFGVCGGCALQHLPGEQQIAHKERVLAEQLQRIGGVEPRQWLAPLTGELWGYRRKARLAVRLVPKKGGVLVGFREKHSPLVTPMESCPVLDPRVGERLGELARLIESLSIADKLPQIEVACGDAQAALVFRHLAPLSAADLDKLADFAARTGLAVLRQPGDEASVTPVYPADPRLTYAIPPAGLEIGFQATDFTQVNAQINSAMVERALEWLQPEPGRRILDLFCGVGNFTLALARSGSEVTGVEGDAALVARAEENAATNAVKADFAVADLSKPAAAEQFRGRFDAVLLDPPRSGAAEVLNAVSATGATRIVYCSCSPATLARDVGVLAREYGFDLSAAGVMDMFPHTAHVESFAVLDRGGGGGDSTLDGGV